MKIGTVTGTLTAAPSVPFLEGQRLVTVRVGLEELAAVDAVGVRPGQEVLLLTGTPARMADPAVPADAIVAAVVQPSK